MYDRIDIEKLKLNLTEGPTITDKRTGGGGYLLYLEVFPGPMYRFCKSTGLPDSPSLYYIDRVGVKKICKIP